MLRSVLLRNEDPNVEVGGDPNLAAWQAEEQHPFSGWDCSPRGVRPQAGQSGDGARPFVSAAKAAGIIERAEEWWGDSVFGDIGALVYYLKATRTVPDFSVARYQSVLQDLQHRLRSSGALTFRCGRFVLAARKPVG